MKTMIYESAQHEMYMRGYAMDDQPLPIPCTHAFPTDDGQNQWICVQPDCNGTNHYMMKQYRGLDSWEWLGMDR